MESLSPPPLQLNSVHKVGEMLGEGNWNISKTFGNYKIHNNPISQREDPKSLFGQL